MDLLVRTWGMTDEGEALVAVGVSKTEPLVTGVYDAPRTGGGG